MANPFTLRVIPSDSPFCNRISEQRELFSHAKNKANLVLFSPRRYGKTSLIKRLQTDMTAKGFFTVYADFFMGSRRRTLLNIFNQKKRPFYQSAIVYPLKPLPHEELVAFLKAILRITYKKFVNKKYNLLFSKYANSNVAKVETDAKKMG